MDKVNETQKLPDEIILKILRETVEPYTIKVHQKTYSKEEFVDALDSPSSSLDYLQHRRLARAREREKAGDHPPMFMCHPAVLVVRNFTTKGLELVSGLPNILNLELVNRIFHDEVRILMKQRFDGKLAIEDQSSFFQGLGSDAWNPASLIRRGTKFPWLKPLITQATASFKDSAKPDLSLLETVETANLRALIMQQRFTSDLNGIDLLSPEHDERILRELRSLSYMLPDFTPYRKKNINILFEVNIGAFILTVDKTVEGVYSIRDRNLGYEDANARQN